MIVAAWLSLGLGLGLAQSLHCAGMCGVFALRASGGTGPAAFPRYLLGKAFTYTFLGALVGAAGASVLDLARPLAVVLGALAGLALVLAGLRLARARPLASGRLGQGVARLLGPLLGDTLTRVQGFSLGALTGLIPCGAVGLALLQGTASGGALQGASVMAGFGLGTGPALAVVALVGRRGTPPGSRWWRGAGAVTMVLLGLVTLWRACHPLASPECPACFP